MQARVVMLHRNMLRSIFQSCGERSDLAEVSEKRQQRHAQDRKVVAVDFSDGFLESYLDEAGANVTASVGAYQLERTGIQLFERIEGDHFTILGLPLLPLLGFLRQQGSLA